MPSTEISEQAWDALFRFFRRPQTARLFGENNTQLMALIAELETTGSPAVGALLSPGLIGRDRTVTERGLAVQTDLLARAAPYEVTTLIKASQCNLLERAPQEQHRWYSLTPDVLVDLAAVGSASTGLLVLASGHHSGWVREAAVSALGRVETPLAPPALIERLNDWVDAVRKAAQRSLRTYLHARYAPLLITHLDALVALERRSRDDHQPFLDQVAMVLKEDEARPALVAGIEDLRPEVRRRCWSVLAQVDPLDVARIRLGLRAQDPWIAMRAAEEVRDAVDASHFAVLLGDMKTSPFPGVRRLAIEIIAQRDDAGADLVPWLVDPAASVREWARFYLGRHDTSFDCLEHYRQLSAAPAPSAGAIAGLAEMAVLSDLGRLMACARDLRARVRLCALRAVARLAPHEAVDPFFAALDDRSAGVRSCAISALAKRAAYWPLGRLTHGLAESPACRRRAVTRLLALRRSGEALDALYRLLDDEDPWVRSQAEQALVLQIPNLIDPFKGRADRCALQAEALLPRLSEAAQRRLTYAVRRLFSDSRWPKI